MLDPNYHKGKNHISFFAKLEFDLPVCYWFTLDSHLLSPPATPSCLSCFCDTCDWGLCKYEDLDGKRSVWLGFKTERSCY